MLLNTAHEYLGRRGWCCNSDGALLRFYVSAPPPAVSLGLERARTSCVALCPLRLSLSLSQ